MDEAYYQEFMKIKKYCNSCGYEYSIDLQNLEALASANCPVCNHLNYVSEYERMDIGLSELCNLKCNMCRRPQDITEITLDQAVSTMSQARLIGINTISFSGGEPFVHPHFRKILKEALRLDFNVELVSNGTLIKDEDIPILEKINCVTISIDGPEVIHDEIRGCPGAWKKAMSTIKKLSKSKAKWGTNTVIQTLNIDHLEETWKEIRKRGRPSYVSFAHVEVIPETRHLVPSMQQIYLSKEIIKGIREDCFKECVHFNDPDFHGDNSILFADKSKRYRPMNGCKIPKHFLGFSPHGFFPCWHQGRAIQEKSLIEALKSDLCKEIIYQGLNRSCIGCNSANYSWDDEWTAGIIQAYKNSDWSIGEIYLSNHERISGKLNTDGISIPIVERKRKGNK